MKRILGWISGLAVLTGCSHPAVHVANASPAELPNGWQLADDKEDGIQVGVPSSWHEGVDSMTNSLPDLAAGAANMESSSAQGTGETDPQAAVQTMQSQLQAHDEAQQKEALQKLREKGIVINVIDSSKPIPGEERTQFYVKKIDHDGNWTLDMARDDEKEYYRGWGADAPQKVKLPIGDAYKFTCDYKSRGGDEIERISYVVVDGKRTYLLRFVSTNNPSAVQQIAQPVAETWRIKPSSDS